MPRCKFSQSYLNEYEDTVKFQQGVRLLTPASTLVTTHHITFPTSTSPILAMALLGRNPLTVVLPSQYQ